MRWNFISLNRKPFSCLRPSSENVHKREDGTSSSILEYTVHGRNEGLFSFLLCLCGASYTCLSGTIQGGVNNGTVV